MRARKVAGRGIAAALSLALLGGATPIGRLDVEVAGLRSPKGLLRLCLTADPANFPKCHNDPLAVRRNVTADTHDLVVEGLPTGAYALAIMHDENGNRRLDTFAGIPTEGFGFSRNPPIRFGPPRFADARFALSGDAEKQQVRIRYML